uniref:Uncharacterized protein n=1 Tax=Bionectria ochroleuca TaxID=29856 RepID=A0A0B7KQJ7_BIOOC
MKRHRFFEAQQSAYLEKLNYSPRSIYLFEICHSEGGNIAPRTTILNDSQAIKWLEADESITPTASNSSIYHATPRFTLLLPGTPLSSFVPSSSKDPTLFPDDFDSIPKPRCVPFYRDFFPRVLKKLQLPGSTPWLLQTTSSHLQTYNLDGCRIGMTLRSINRGILAIDFALSLSYNTITGDINALLLGISPEQSNHIRQVIEELTEYALHPAFLPTVLLSCARCLLQRLIAQEHSSMYKFEAGVMGTDVIIINERGIIRDKELNSKELPGLARGILQRVVAWECHTKSLLLQLDAVKSFVTSLERRVKSDAVHECNDVILERLSFLYQEGQQMLLVALLVKDRANMQLAGCTGPTKLRNLIRDIPLYQQR